MPRSVGQHFGTTSWQNLQACSLSPAERWRLGHNQTSGRRPRDVPRAAPGGTTSRARRHTFHHVATSPGLGSTRYSRLSANDRRPWTYSIRYTGPLQQVWTPYLSMLPTALLIRQKVITTIGYMPCVFSDVYPKFSLIKYRMRMHCR